MKLFRWLNDSNQFDYYMINQGQLTLINHVIAPKIERGTLTWEALINTLIEEQQCCFVLTKEC
jgi:hypothetical protein